ncbi:UNVERIFIED_CONTAM: Retrovirus-related Pol polyprotein from transposon gypsy [Sesamum radiatum]|uniref:Retrovirus-related Pol polyprotein from transposon gypsy n=1 Tax=Sesamum radiatum TaxID=300843 RepID=A0AAW2R148_SESRA
MRNQNNNALVISATLSNFWVKKVLVDSGSSTDIIFYDAYVQLGIDNAQLWKVNNPLTGFSGEMIEPLEEVTLPLSLGSYPKRSSKMVKFLIVNAPSAYNIILGRLSLNIFRAIASTYHMKLKFQLRRCGRATGGERMARECYANTLKRSREKLGENPINEKGKKKLTEANYEEVFAWTMTDLHGISPDVITHRLIINPNAKPVKQKKKNVWGGEKSSDKRGDLNKACPKDPFPLPWIDVLVDSTSGCEMLSFLYAYQGYNQIPLALEDQEKVSFVTDQGVLCYNVMPFGLKNVSAIYQCLVNHMFQNQIGRNMEVYIDDMLVKSVEEQDHIKDFAECFQILETFGMKLNPAKCTFRVRGKNF